MDAFFQSTLNTRPILENNIKYIRSDVPIKVSEIEKNWLLSNDITTVLDLRTDEERANKPCPLMADSRFAYYCFPVAGGNKVPRCVDDVSKSYISMINTQFHEIIDFLLKVKSNVLYFCTAGKDRTGVVSAVLLYKLGMPLAYIIDDYMKSKHNLEALLINYAKRDPTIDIDVITPHRRYIEEFIKWYIDSEKA